MLRLTEELLAYFHSQPLPKTSQIVPPFISHGNNFILFRTIVDNALPFFLFFFFECRWNEWEDLQRKWESKNASQKVSFYEKDSPMICTYITRKGNKIPLNHYKNTIASLVFVVEMTDMNNLNVRQEIETDVNTSYRHSNISPECALVCCDSVIICLIISVFHFSWCESVCLLQGRFTDQLFFILI